MNFDPLNNFPIVFTDRKERLIPETLVNSSADEYDGFEIFNEPVEITAGFMEPDFHGFKEYASYAIFENDPNTIQTIPAFDDYNIGIDYDVNTADESTKAWYSGEVISAENSENGYGNRVIVDTDVTYEFNGREYQVRTAYAHLDTIDVQVGDRISQGQSVGEMGGTGNTASLEYPNNYSPHVDLQISIQLDDGKLVNISPNLLQKQLAERFCKQYGPPTLEVLERQRGLPPGTLHSWSNGCTPPPPPPHAEDAQNGFERSEQAGSPLVLDLDGDGIELTAVNTTNVFFDVDGDGFREATGWVQSDDGLLVLDRNNDGYINDNSELFGNFTTSGFVELRAIDDNGDNYIDANDSQFADLQIWRDLD